MANTSLLGSYSGQDNSALMFRNRIINGNCLVAQRGNATINTNITVYGGCDRMLTGTGGYTTVSGTISQAGTLGGSVSSSGYVQQLSLTTTGSGFVFFRQRIEASNCADLNSKQVTISVTLYQDTGNTVSPTINLYKPNALDNWAGSTFLSGTTISLPSGAYTRFTWTTTLGSTDASNGLGVYIDIPTGAVSTKFFQIADLQLEAGPVATPFERRPIGTELALCQRYYVRQAFNASGVSSSGDARYYFSLTYPVTMRVAPTTVSWVSGGNVSNGQPQGAITAGTGSAGISASTAVVEVTGPTVLPNGTGAIMYNNPIWQLAAEL